MILSNLAVTEPNYRVAKIHKYFYMQTFFEKFQQLWSKKYNTQHGHSHAVTNIKKNSAPPIWSKLESAENADKISLPDNLFFPFGNLFCHLNCLLPYSHEVATPEHFKFLFCITPLQKLYSKVLHL